jgi:uncharacterized membrane protein YeaQ/YmgE (transglycosylase-associated protein family)
MGTPIGGRRGLVDHARGNARATKGGDMAVLGWIVLGLVIAVLASGFGRGEEGLGALAARCASGVVGAVLGGLVAVVTGVGAIDDFFHTGTWLIALGGAILALVSYELARSSRARRGVAAPGSAGWAGPGATREGETLDRNW